MFPGHRLQYCVYYMMLGCKVNYTMPGCKVNYMMLGCKVNYTMLGCKVNYMMPGCKVNYMMPGCKVNTEVQYCVYCMMLRCKVNTDVITSVWRTSDRMGSSKVLLPQKKKIVHYPLQCVLDVWLWMWHCCCTLHSFLHLTPSPLQLSKELEAGRVKTGHTLQLLLFIVFWPSGLTEVLLSG